MCKCWPIVLRWTMFLHADVKSLGLECRTMLRLTVVLMALGAVCAQAQLTLYRSGQAIVGW
jgi:hypothetical protein